MIPSLFLGHGAPTIIYENNEYTDFLKSYGKTIKKPKAVIIFSAHYEAPVQLIGASEQYNMIYDFYGFPAQLYTVKYNAGSDLNLANKISSLLNKNNISNKLDYERGIDHGSWTMLKLLFPEIDVPVVTMSVNISLSNEEQYNIGKSLEALKQDDILIIGSGGIVHNLGLVDFEAENKIHPWSLEFNKWIENKILNWDLSSILNYDKLAPNAHLAVPRSEHFVPLLLSMGSGDSTRNPKLLKRIFQYGNLSLDFWEFK